MNNVDALIDATYPVFKLDDHCSDVIARLGGEGLKSAAVLEGENYVAMVSMADINPPPEDSGWLASTALREIGLRSQPALHRDEHLLDCFIKILDFPDDVVPVTEGDGPYLGVIFKSAVIRRIATLFHFGEGNASTIEIEVPAMGVRISEIIGVIEKNDASVVSFGSYTLGEAAEGLIVTFRVVTHDFYRLIKNLENYGYTIRFSTINPEADLDSMRERALEFIRFMDM